LARLFRIIDSVIDKATVSTGSIAVVIMALLAGFITAQVIARYVLSIHIRGLFDLATYCLIIFTFLAAAFALREKQHISIEIFTSLLGSSARTYLRIAVYILGLSFPVILGWYGAQWAYSSLTSGVMTITQMSIYKGILIAFIPVGCILLTLQIIRKLVFDIRSLPKLFISPKALTNRFRDNPWPQISILILGLLAGFLLATYVNKVLGIIIITLTLLFSGMPIFIALGLAGYLGLTLTVNLGALAQAPFIAYRSVDSFPLTCLPLFILGGLILEEGKIIHKVFDLFKRFSGRFISAPLVITILIGGFFCACSGSSVATTAVIAAITLPILLKQGFGKSICAGVVSGGTIGTVIPPSIGYIIYGVITGASVGALFIAGIIPGIVIFSLYCLYVIIRGIVSKQSLFEKGQVPQQIIRQENSTQDKLRALKDAGLGLFTPVFILGGIYLGIFTPTEAAAVMVVYAIIVCVFITRTIKWQGLMNVFLKSAKISSMLLCIIFSAHIFGAVTSQLQIAASLVTFIQSAGLSSYAVLALLFTVLVILGMLMDAASIQLITLPVFYPLAIAAGFDPIWFGVFYIITLEIGLLTPPVGLNLFSIQGVSDIPLGAIIKGSAPFLAIMTFSLLLFVLFPQLVTWLPSTM
jgi:tripartite ATP-independent transporter DctM subunit